MGIWEGSISRREIFFNFFFGKIRKWEKKITENEEETEGIEEKNGRKEIKENDDDEKGRIEEANGEGK